MQGGDLPALVRHPHPQVPLVAVDADQVPQEGGLAHARRGQDETAGLGQTLFRQQLRHRFRHAGDVMGDADGECRQAPELPDASPLGEGGTSHAQAVASWQWQVASAEGFHGVVEGGMGGDLDHVLELPLGHPLGARHQLFPTSLIHHPQPRPGTQAQFLRCGLLGRWEGVEQVAQGGWKALGGQCEGGMVFCHGSRLTILPHPMTACPVVCKDFPKCRHLGKIAAWCMPQR